MKTMMASLSASKKAAAGGSGAGSAGAVATPSPGTVYSSEMAHLLDAGPRRKIIKTERKPTQRAMNVDFDNLRIVVECGKDLAPKDANGKSDPYLRIFCGSYKYKTKVGILICNDIYICRWSRKPWTLSGIMRSLKSPLQLLRSIPLKLSVGIGM
jgi:hypothetical protein